MKIYNYGTVYNIRELNILQDIQTRKNIEIMSERLAENAVVNNSAEFYDKNVMQNGPNLTQISRSDILNNTNSTNCKFI